MTRTTVYGRYYRRNYYCNCGANKGGYPLDAQRAVHLGGHGPNNICDNTNHVVCHLFGHVVEDQILVLDCLYPCAAEGDARTIMRRPPHDQDACHLPGVRYRNFMGLIRPL